MRHYIFLVLIHIISILLLSILTFIFFAVLNKHSLKTIMTDVSIWAMIYFIAFSLSSGVHKFFLNKSTILWNILSSLSILTFIFCIVQFTWGFDWNDSKTYIGFLFFAITGWLYPEFFKGIKRRIEMKV